MGGVGGGRLWAITSYYNPVANIQRLPNYKLFRANLGIPLVTVELSFDGRFELEKHDADILIQISGAAVLWQKERLLNLALKAVPAETEHIAWLDCDVIFKRKDWAVGAKTQLQDLNVLQLFSEVVFTNSGDHIGRIQVQDGAKVPGLLSLANAKNLITIGSTIGKKVVRYAPGFAWAAKRSIVANHCFYDAGIVGGGDSLLAAAALGQHELISRRYSFNEARRRHYFKWAIPFYKSVAGRIGHFGGIIFHLKHGEVENRGYAERQRSFATFDFDPDIDLTIGQNGAWHWARPRPDLEDFLKSYFIRRAEGENRADAGQGPHGRTTRPADPISTSSVG